MVQSQRERRRSVLTTPKPRVRFSFEHVFSEKSLAALKLARRNKVEEIKKKTNYYETRDLLERYEDGPPNGWPRNGPVVRVQPQQPPSTPQRAAPAVPPNTPANPPTPISPGLQSQLVSRTSPNALSLSWTLAPDVRSQEPLSSLSRLRASNGTTSSPMCFSGTTSRP